MKILQVLYSGLGGHGNVFFSMISADENRQYKYEALFNGIEDIRQEYINKCNDFGVKWSFVKKKPGFDVLYYKRLLVAIKKSNADIIFLHSSSYILPAILFNLCTRIKKKIIIRETQANKLKNKMEWVWLCISFFSAYKIVFLSDEFNDEVKAKLGVFYRYRKAAIIPNGIDLNVFHPVVKEPATMIMIGMQSRLTKNKDHLTLLKAFAILKNQGYGIKLKIAGDGPCKKELMIAARKLKIDSDVEFMGMLAEEYLVKFLQQINVYVHASFGETMSTAIMQAMACKLPVVASDVPGINNMITNNKTGILVQVQNEYAMSNAIKILLTDTIMANDVSNNAYEFATYNYSNLIMFKKYSKLFT